jgi:hypothetical protein
VLFQSYNKELSYANIAFKRLFSNIVIERQVGNKKKSIEVPCIIGNRSRIFKGLENSDRKAEYTLPMIVIQRNGLTRNADRLSNLHNEIKYETSYKVTNYDLFTPVPIDIAYDVTVIAKNPGDIDMIASNFIPFFNSDLFVRTIHPKFTDVMFNSQVVMGDSISEDHSDEIDSSADDIISMTFNFTYKTFIFCGNKRVNAYGTNTVPVISTYISTYIDPETSAETSVELSTVIDQIYDGFVPAITAINAGWYAVPYVYTADEYWAKEDSGEIPQPDVDRMRWYVQEGKEYLGWDRLSGSTDPLSVIL